MGDPKAPALADRLAHSSRAGDTVADVETYKAALAEAQEYQTATTDVLRVISESRADLATVFQTIAESAVRLCGAEVSTVTRFDGELVHLGAIHGADAAGIARLRQTFPMRPSGAGGAARAVRECAIVQIPDVRSDEQYRIQGAALAAGFRSILAVPMMHDGKAVGAITVGRAATGYFGEIQIRLLSTFAEQAKIAIQIASLMEEIREKSQRIEEQAGELAGWNQTLEARVAEQVGQIDRMSKLTRFLSPKISNLIMAGEADDPLKTRRAEISVVYVDLRGFTAFTETADPEEVMVVLREYHAELGRAITEFDGTIEHFAGDGAMILFNAPMPVEDHELRAIKMCLQIRDAVGLLSQEWRKRGYQLGLGAGIAEGYATIGTTGFEGRLDFGAIGTVCNMAARLCGEAQGGQILISPRVFAKVEPHVEATFAGELNLKGFHRPIAAHNVTGLRGSES